MKVTFTISVNTERLQNDKNVGLNPYCIKKENASLEPIAAKGHTTGLSRV
jgi:hypothetical protein